MKEKPFAPLAGIRAIEIGDETGHYCGKLLVDLGADVLKVEPPGGVASRRAWSGVDEDQAAASIAFDYYNAGKRSLVLDHRVERDKERFEALLSGADLLIESLGAADYEGWGLQEDRIRAGFPGLVTASISGFGRTGPHADWEWTDLTCFAAGGLMFICGPADAAPVVAPNAQAFHIGSLHAAVALAAALQAPEGERGCYIDISIQECLAMQEQHIVRYFDDGHVIGREGSQHGSAVPGRIYGCADGDVYIAVGIGPEGWDELMVWLGQPETLSDEVWSDPWFRRENHDVIDLIVAEFTAGRRKEELTRTGQAHGVRILPVNEPLEFVNHRQTKSRNLFVSGEAGSIWMRPPAQFGGRVLGKAGAPRKLNADGRRVERDWLRHARSTPMGSRRQPLSRALAGLRVVEFGFLIAGPMLGRILRDYGADVNKVETRSRPDGMRRSARNFLELNRGKSSLTVNMKTEAGVEFMQRLLGDADVVIENMKAGVSESWGLGYRRLTDTNPGLIQIDMQGLGFSGPCKEYTTLGASLMSFVGMSWLWNHPDTVPAVGSQLSYPDYVGGLHGALAVLTALHVRHESNVGTQIELAQFESAAAMIGPAYLRALAGIPPAQIGNATRHSPGGVFPCRGEDEWIAIETRDGDDWRRLCRLIGETETAGDAHLSSPRGRWSLRNQLDTYLSDWTRDQDKHELARRLQESGVPAAAVENAADLVKDPHLAARGFFSEVRSWDDVIYGIPGNGETIDGRRLDASRDPPTLGADTERVALEDVGVSRKEFEALSAAGAFV